MSTITISYADVPGFPAGSAVANINVTVSNPDATVQPVQSLPPATTSATFTATQVGNYGISVQAVDATGAALGPAVTATFSVQAPSTVTLSLPSSITVA